MNKQTYFWRKVFSTTSSGVFPSGPRTTGRFSWGLGPDSFPTSSTAGVSVPFALSEAETETWKTSPAGPRCRRRSGRRSSDVVRDAGEVSEAAHGIEFASLEEDEDAARPRRIAEPSSEGG